MRPTGHAVCAGTDTRPTTKAGRVVADAAGLRNRQNRGRQAASANVIEVARSAIKWN
jgi:hypothetical protein